MSRYRTDFAGLDADILIEDCIDRLDHCNGPDQQDHVLRLALAMKKRGGAGLMKGEWRGLINTSADTGVISQDTEIELMDHFDVLWSLEAA